MDYCPMNEIWGASPMLISPNSYFVLSFHCALSASLRTRTIVVILELIRAIRAQSLVGKASPLEDKQSFDSLPKRPACRLTSEYRGRLGQQLLEAREGGALRFLREPRSPQKLGPIGLAVCSMRVPVCKVAPKAPTERHGDRLRRFDGRIETSRGKVPATVSCLIVSSPVASA